jgi:hypothetical protein
MGGAKPEGEELTVGSALSVRRREAITSRVARTDSVETDFPHAPHRSLMLGSASSFRPRTIQVYSDSHGPERQPEAWAD